LGHPDPGERGLILPALVAHADWSAGTAGRMLAVAERRSDGTWRGLAPAAPPPDLIAALTTQAAGGAVLLGFDFPIGLPGRYAGTAGIAAFPTWLAELGDEAWDRFRTPAASAGEICADAPYYPLRPGGASQVALAAAHGVAAYADLLRRCDRPTAARPAACCMFWTLGPKQCGRAALAGWHEVLRPALRSGEALHLWPFAGVLADLLGRGGCVVAETYPTEFYREVGLPKPFSKRRQDDRRAAAGGLRAAAARAGLEPNAALEAVIADGFGPRREGENAFDAVVGLIGMLLVLRGHRPADPPADPTVRRIEGWMLGLDPATLRT
jgi:hypothetical protein